MPLRLRLIGRRTEQRWRQSMIAEGLIVPVHGAFHAALADLTASKDLAGAIKDAQAKAGALPLCVLIGEDDPLPDRPYADLDLLRAGPQQAGAVAAGVRRAAGMRLYALEMAARVKGFAAAGAVYGGPRRGDDSQLPAALLTDPQPSLLPLLKERRASEITAPLSTNQTLRLLERGRASSLIIHLTKGREHRLPVLKLVRRQTDLKTIPVAVVHDHWTEAARAAWYEAGADLLAGPEEFVRVLHYLDGAAQRHRTSRKLQTALCSSAISDDGAPAPTFGKRLFQHIIDEHREDGRPITYGIIALEPQGESTDQFGEALLYMTMALSPLDLVTELEPGRYLIAMPHADRLHAGRVMQSLTTLVEDLRFGTDEDPVLMSAHTAVADGKGRPPAEIAAKLVRELNARPRVLALA